MEREDEPTGTIVNMAACICEAISADLLAFVTHCRSLLVFSVLYHSVLLLMLSLVLQLARLPVPR
jgi:hypothetical protein